MRLASPFHSIRPHQVTSLGVAVGTRLLSAVYHGLNRWRSVAWGYAFFLRRCLGSRSGALSSTLYRASPRNDRGGGVLSPDRNHSRMVPHSMRAIRANVCAEVASNISINRMTCFTVRASHGRSRQQYRPASHFPNRMR
jgi:hypothetical protein